MEKACLILLIEDDENDAFFIQRALASLGFMGPLVHLQETQSAKAYLTGAPPYEDREKHPIPDIIVADSAVNYRDSGVEFLEWVRSLECGKELPFVMLSGGMAEKTRERAVRAGVRRILSKGTDFQALKDSLRSILQEFPSHCRKWLTP